MFSLPRRYGPRKKLPRFIPELMCLEGRIVPSTFTEMEVNDTTAAANDVSVPVGDILTTAPGDWLTIMGTIGVSADVDFFRFSLGTAAGVFFDFDSNDIGLSEFLDGQLEVYDGDGNLIGDNLNGYDFKGFPAPAVSTFDPVFREPALYLDLAAGTYFVRAAATEGSVGDYHLLLLADTHYAATVPVLDSNPPAPDTVYLDFDGHSATSGSWGTYAAAPFDLDGNPSLFSPAERLAVRNVWRMVGEDFSPFNVNVTTTDPGAFEDRTAFRQVVTSSDSTIIGRPAGQLGAAAFGSYSNNDLSNAGFTFAGNFGAYVGGISGRVMAAALEQGNTSSQQIGRALLLDHFSSGGPGGPGQASVIPHAIMAIPDRGLNRETWASGRDERGFLQDDRAVITDPENGISYRPDDHGNTLPAATVLTAAGNVYTATGIIEQLADFDFFRFLASGPTTIRAAVDTYINNLDAELRLFAADGSHILTDDPPDSFGAAISMELEEGTYFIEVRSDRDPGESGQYSLQIDTVLTPPNTAPVLAPIGDRSGDEGATLTFTAAATDSESPPQTLTFTLDPGAPAGAGIDPATGVFTGTPTEVQGPGTFTATVRVTDNGDPELSDSETITITVHEVNQAPALGAIGNQTVDEGGTLSFTATASDADLPANGLTFSLDGGAPPGAAIDAATGAFTWTPAEAQGSGSFTVTVRVTDDGSPALDDAETITITVNEVNRAPVLAAIGNKAVVEGDTLTFTAAATDPDLPPGALAFSLDPGAPAGASIDPFTAAFAWTPSGGPGTFTATVRVTDDGLPPLSDFETITITVRAAPPILNNVTITPTVPERQTAFLGGTVTDPGAQDTLTLTVDWGDGSPAESFPLAPGTQSFSLPHRYVREGAFAVGLTLRDEDGGVATATARIAVANADILVTSAGAGAAPHVRVFDANTVAPKFSFLAYDEGFQGGVRVAAGDVNGDGVPDIITGAGAGAGPHVKVFDGRDRTLLASFHAFAPAFSGGVFVAAGNFDGDLEDEIVVGAGPKAGPHVRIFDIAGGGATQIAGALGSFWAFDPAFSGGVTVAAANFDGLGADEIITGAGPGAGPHVKVFRGDGVVLASFHAYSPRHLAGVFVAAGDVDGDGRAEVFTGPGGGLVSAPPLVRVFRGGDAAERANFLVFDPSFSGGVRVATVDRNGDGRADLLASAGPRGTPQLRTFRSPTLEALDSFFAFDPLFKGGLFAGG